MNEKEGEVRESELQTMRKIVNDAQLKRSQYVEQRRVIAVKLGGKKRKQRRLEVELEEVEREIPILEQEHTRIYREELRFMRATGLIKYQEVSER